MTIEKKNVSESKMKDDSRKVAGNVIDLLTIMRENYGNFEFSHDELNYMLKVYLYRMIYRHVTPD